jgi:hypothetical protein
MEPRREYASLRGLPWSYDQAFSTSGLMQKSITFLSSFLMLLMYLSFLCFPFFFDSIRKPAITRSVFLSRLLLLLRNLCRIRNLSILSSRRISRRIIPRERIFG